MCNWQCQDTGTMNRPLRLTECFATNFVGVRWCFAECSPRNWQPLAAVGADLSRPRIRKHIRNGEGKCVFGYGNMHFGNVRIRAR